MFLILSLVSLMGCPAPVEDVAPGVPGPPPGDGTAPPPGPADAAAPPADGSAPPLPPGAAATDLSALITGDKVKINGTIEGAETTRVNVLQPGATPEDVPTLLAAFEVEGGKFTLDAPATLEKPLYFAAFADLTGDGPTPDDLSAGTEKGVKLEGKDVSVALKLGTDNSWVKRMPWPAPEGGPPGGPPAGAGPPPPDGGPANPPPADGAPAGAPPPGGAAPGGAAPGGAAPGGAAPGGAAPGAPPPGGAAPPPTGAEAPPAPK